jgi:general secretion pathway protein M
LPKFPREQLIAVAVLAVLLVLCSGALTATLYLRTVAAAELAQRQEMLARLTARVTTLDAGHDPTRAAAAPASAFFDAATPALASADLQAYVEKLAERHAVLVAFAAQTSVGDKVEDEVRIEASMDISLRALQLLLYQLETGTPYIFVDAITVRPTGGSTTGVGEDLPLRATLELRAPWHRRAT